VVVQSSAIAVARCARARPLPPGPRPGPSRHRCRPPLPPTRAEPRPSHLVTSGLDTRPPHPCQEFREPPCPPPSPPDGDNDADDQRSADATMNPSPEDYRPRATQSTSSSSTPPTTGGGEGCRTQHPVAPGITQPLCQVPPHDHTSSSSTSAGDWRGGSRGDGGCRARRQRQKRKRRR
jgi:hypothetical protein